MTPRPFAILALMISAGLACAEELETSQGPVQIEPMIEGLDAPSIANWSGSHLCRHSDSPEYPSQEIRLRPTCFSAHPHEKPYAVSLSYSLSS